MYREQTMEGHEMIKNATLLLVNADSDFAMHDILCSSSLYLGSWCISGSWALRGDAEDRQSKYFVNL